jgi:hypothetical protein
LRLRHLAAFCLGCSGCAQMCGFDVGVPIQEVLSAQPDGGAPLPDEADAATTPPAAPDAAPASSSMPGDCEEYCTLQESNCGEDFANYFDRSECLALCARYPQGTAASNGFECRLQAVRGARESQEPIQDCAISSRGGNADGLAQCGTNCEAYCQLVMSVCPTPGFADAAECLAECAGLRDDGLPVDPEMCVNGGLHERSGSSVQCRLWHVGAAARTAWLGRSAAEFMLHCGHALGAPPCADSDAGLAPGCARP